MKLKDPKDELSVVQKDMLVLGSFLVLLITLLAFH